MTEKQERPEIPAEEIIEVKNSKPIDFQKPYLFIYTQWWFLLMSVPFTFLAIAGAGSAAGLKNKLRFFPLLWFAGIFMVAEFGSARLSEFRPIHKLPRFMAMFSTPLAALGGIFIGKVANKKALFFSVLLIILLLIMISSNYKIPVWGLRP